MNTIKLFVKPMTVLLCLVIAVAFLPLSSTEAYASTVKLNKQTLHISPGTSAKLKLEGASAGVKWSSSQKSIAAVSKSGIVKAKNCGTTLIAAKYKGKKYTCKVFVESKTVINARNLRAYVLKKGKKDELGWKSIEILAEDSGDTEGSFARYCIKAKKGYATMKFEYHHTNFSPDNSSSVVMNFNLISKSSATIVTEFWDTYSAYEGECAKGTISTSYTTKGKGLKWNKFIQYTQQEDEETGDYEDVSFTISETEIKATMEKRAQKRVSTAFKAWNQLTKKAGFSMKAIGFKNYK